MNAESLTSGECLFLGLKPLPRKKKIKIGQNMRVCYLNILDAWSISSGQNTNKHFSSAEETEP